jgi:hypothetical protein
MKVAVPPAFHQSVAAASEFIRYQARDQIDRSHGFCLSLMESGFDYGSDAAEPELS